MSRPLTIGEKIYLAALSEQMGIAFSTAERNYRQSPTFDQPIDPYYAEVGLMVQRYMVNKVSEMVEELKPGPKLVQ